MKNLVGKIGLSLQILIVVTYFLLMGWSVDYLLSLAEKDIPFIADFAIGFIGGTVTIPFALVIKILEITGVF